MYYNGNIYSSIGNKIKVAAKGTNKQRTYITVDGLGVLNYLELYNRLLRHGIHNFYKINETIDCLVIKGKILIFEEKKLLKELVLEKGSRPLRNGIVFEDGSIIYCEYHGNKTREPVNIYKYNYTKDKKEILYTFNNIRHIHCIYRDINNQNCLYIGTGDFDEECGIYRLNQTDTSMEKLGGGSQAWRAVSILQNNNALYWGTDDPDGQNFIMKYNLENNKLQKVKPIVGPAYYSTITKDKHMFIATTIEDRRKHRAVIYKSVDGEVWDKYKEFRKDIFHTKYFGYGKVEFENR